MAAGSLADADTGTVVFLLVLSPLLALWPLAFLTDFRGYRDSHARRSLAAGNWFRQGIPLADEPDQDAARAFTRVGQYVVRVVFLVVAVVLVMVACVELVRRLTSGLRDSVGHDQVEASELLRVGDHCRPRTY